MMILIFYAAIATGVAAVVSIDRWASRRRARRAMEKTLASGFTTELLVQRLRYEQDKRHRAALADASEAINRTLEGRGR